ncbi:hypothetical protein LIER_38496 [Lithospermum erythrorhizon]|uniref:Uncharacterized protein n=1 Tax=Lithospermum erythrorhizon TaxID=34254 RepID=A0AAV3Q3C2_LITER
MLLRRPWIHNNNVVLSTPHQCLRYFKDSSERTIKADENPFIINESYFADAKCYQRKNTNEAQPKEEPEAHKATQPSYPSAEEEVTETLKGLTLPPA